MNPGCLKHERNLTMGHARRPVPEKLFYTTPVLTGEDKQEGGLMRYLTDVSNNCRAFL